MAKHDKDAVKQQEPLDDVRDDVAGARPARSGPVSRDQADAALGSLRNDAIATSSTADHAGAGASAVPASQSTRMGDPFEVTFSAAPGALWHVDAPSTLAVRSHAPSADGLRVEGEALAPPGGFLRAKTNGEDEQQSQAFVQVPAPTVATWLSRRVHQPGGFEDEAAGVLYPGDLLRVEATVANVGERAELTGAVSDHAGAFETRSAEYDPATRRLAVLAEATQEATTHANLDIVAKATGQPFTRPLHVVTVEHASHGMIEDAAREREPGRGVENPRSVRTSNIEDAKGVLTTGLQSLLLAQQEGVHLAKRKLLVDSPTRTVPAWKAILQAMSSAALKSVFGGVEDALAAALAPGLGDKDIAKGVLGIGDAAIAAVTGGTSFSGLPSDGGVLDEKLAITTFCDSQDLALRHAAQNVEARVHNSFQAFRALEDEHPGRGLSAIERFRNALAARESSAMADQKLATLEQWMLYVAHATRGSADAVTETDLSKEGRGELRISVSVDPGDVGGAPRVKVVTSSLRQPLLGEYLRERGGRLVDLGLPYVIEADVVGVPSASFQVGRGERGTITYDHESLDDVWDALRGGASAHGFAGARWLYVKGGGKLSDLDTDQGITRGVTLVATMQNGARALAEEDIGGLDVASLPLLDLEGTSPRGGGGA